MGDADTTDENLWRRVLPRLLLPIALLTFVNAFDRMNVSYAGAALSRELGLSPEQFGAGVSLFFVAYLLFQYPHARLLQRWGLRRWLFASVALWGVSSLAMAYASAPWHFAALRFLLGTAEAGFAPGMTWLISQWTPPAMRGRGLAIALAAVPIALVLGGPICGSLLAMTNPLGISPWRWMFLVASVPNVLLALAAPLWFVDRPEDARWLTPQQRDRLVATAAAEPTARRSAWAVLGMRGSRLWSCAAIWLCVMTGSYALVYWLPQLVQRLAPGQGALVIGSLSALPQAALAAGLLLNARHSDRSGERVRHVAIGAALGGAALLVAVALPAGAGTLALLCVAGFGLGATQGVFWTMPAALGIDGGRPSVEAIALISMAGTAGGIVGPWLLGAIVGRSGGFAPGIVVLAALLVIAAAITLAVGRAVPLAPRTGRTG